MENMTRKECERCQSWIDRDVGCIAKVCPHITPQQGAAELIRAYGSSGLATKATGIPPLVLRRVASGKIEPQPRIANAIRYHVERLP